MAVTNSSFDAMQADLGHNNPQAVFLWAVLRDPKGQPISRKTRPELGIGFSALRRAECTQIARKFNIEGWDENFPVTTMVRMLEAAWFAGKLKIDMNEIALRAAQENPMVKGLLSKLADREKSLSEMESRIAALETVAAPEAHRGNRAQHR